MDDEIRGLTVDDVIARIEATPTGYARAVASDADGTLWELDVGDALFRLVASRDRVADVVRPQVAAFCARYLGVVPEGIPAQAEALIAGHAAGKVPVEPLCDLEAEAVGGRPVKEFEALLDEVAEMFLPRVRRASVALLRELRDRGYAVHVVSGSLAALVAATLSRAGVTVDRISGGRLYVDGDTVLARLDGPIPLHGGKVDALRAAGHWPAALGMGDGGWDATFLRGCALPLLVHPKETLRAAMKDHPAVARLTDLP